MSTGEPIWIFLHLSKSGGTTLAAHLARHLAWDEAFVEFGNWGTRYRAAAGRSDFPARPLAERQKAKALAGHRIHYGIHLLLPGREPRYLAAIRDPAERCVSLYNFRSSRGETALPFDQWYDKVYLASYRDSAVRFFAERHARRPLPSLDAAAHLALAQRLLARCWMVTTTAQLGAMLALLSDALRIPPDWSDQRVAGASPPLDLVSHPRSGERIERHVVLDEAIRVRVYADSAADLALYRWVEASGWRGADAEHC